MINFKDWKFVSQSGDKAKVKHKDGHEMDIFMKGLPKIQREQIMRLAKANEYKDGGEVQHFDDQPDGVQAPDNSQPPAPPTVQIFTGGQSQPQPIPAAVNPAVAYQKALAQAKAPQVPGVNGAPDVPTAGPVLNSNGQPNMAAVNQAQQAAVTGQQMIGAATAKAMVPENQAYIQAQGDLLKNPTAVQNILQSETDSLNRDTKGGKINTQAWLNNPGVFGQKGALKQALSGIGLVLGGVGAGQLGSTDNPALRALNTQIDREIDAQQKSFNNKDTILGRYQNLFGNSVTASNMAKNALAEAHKSYIDLIANQMGTPQSKVIGEKLKADIATDQQRRNMESSFDITGSPGYHPVDKDVSAMNGATSPAINRAQSLLSDNVPHGTPQAPGHQAAEPTQAGMVPAGAQPKPFEMTPAEEMENERAGQILIPDAEEKLKNFKWRGKIQGEDYNKVQDAIQRTRQIESTIKGVHKLFPKIKSEATYSDWLANKINPTMIGEMAGGLAGAGSLMAAPETGGASLLAGALAAGKAAAKGGAAGAALKQGLHGLAGQAGIKYNSDRAALEKLIAGGLGSTPVNSHQLQDVLDNQTPTIWDKKDAYGGKLKNIDEFFKNINAKDRAILDEWGFTNKTP